MDALGSAMLTFGSCAFVLGIGVAVLVRDLIDHFKAP